ncbi:hypothetical protein [Aridibaculum aurantiacum]|uniref:hypothetical protein n=1 Tax=Aridibaculum aurantiacum TaxID=2810307 RepID=UPI001A97ABE3|nr:hypothetical protein [Aridibaculum aurantiacum]
MKKMFFAICILALTAGSVMAQTGERGGRARGGQMNEMMKERLKSELKLTDAQTDSVVAIQQEFQSKAREVRMSQDLSEDDKKKKMEALEAERQAKYKTILNEEQQIKLNAFYENMRKMREQRGQGGQGGQGQWQNRN